MPKDRTAGLELFLARTVRIRLEGLYMPLRRMLIDLLRDHGVRESGLSLTFVGRDRIRKLNREYLGRDRVTDVIAFDLSGEGKGRMGGRPLVGDIYVCVPRAAVQARGMGIPLEEELLRLAAHGALHLLGHDHIQPGQATRMTELQELAVRKYFRERRVSRSSRNEEPRSSGRSLGRKLK